jgi:hypothetical protein
MIGLAFEPAAVPRLIDMTGLFGSVTSTATSGQSRIIARLT